MTYACGYWAAFDYTSLNYPYLCMILFTFLYSINFTIHITRNLLLSGNQRQDRIKCMFQRFYPLQVAALLTFGIGLLVVIFTDTYLYQISGLIWIFTVIFTFLNSTFVLIPLIHFLKIQNFDYMHKEAYKLISQKKNSDKSKTYEQQTQINQIKQQQAQNGQKQEQQDNQKDVSITLMTEDNNVDLAKLIQKDKQDSLGYQNENAKHYQEPENQDQISDCPINVDLGEQLKKQDKQHLLTQHIEEDESTPAIYSQTDFNKRNEQQVHQQLQSQSQVTQGGQRNIAQESNSLKEKFEPAQQKDYESEQCETTESDKFTKIGFNNHQNQENYQLKNKVSQEQDSKGQVQQQQHSNFQYSLKNEIYEPDNQETPQNLFLDRTQSRVQEEEINLLQHESNSEQQRNQQNGDIKIQFNQDQKLDGSQEQTPKLAKE